MEDPTPTYPPLSPPPENLGEATSTATTTTSKDQDQEDRDEALPVPPPPYESPKGSPKPPQRQRKKTVLCQPKIEPPPRPKPPKTLLPPPPLPQEESTLELQDGNAITSSTTTTAPPPSSPTLLQKYLTMEVYVTFVASFSFMCIGLQRSYTSPALSSMKASSSSFFSGDNLLSNNAIAWIAASPPLASFFGTILSGLTLHYCGRKKTLLLLTLPYLGGWLLISFASNLGMIVGGRALTGLGDGLSTAAAPIYVSECVRAEIRGFLGILPPMLLSFGVLLGFSASTINVEWYQLSLLMVLFPALLLILLVPIPESPTWLAIHGREPEALQNLQALRGKGVPLSSEEIEEVSTLRKRQHSLPTSGSQSFMEFVLSDLWGRREIRKPAFIASTLMIFQQLCGANAVIYYLSLILDEAELDESGRNATFIQFFHQQTQPEMGGGAAQDHTHTHSWASLIFGLVQFSGFFLSLPLIDRVGRRILLLGSALLMVLPHLTLGLYFWAKLYIPPDTYIRSLKVSSLIGWAAGWFPLTCLCAMIAAYSIGLGPVPFIIMGEVFPPKVRGYMVSLVSLVNHLTLFFIVRVFPTFMYWLGAHTVFWAFGAFSLISAAHVALFIPETKGKSLGEIEMEFKGPRGGDKGCGNDKCKCCQRTV